jgi:hypothetical protein
MKPPDIADQRKSQVRKLKKEWVKLQTARRNLAKIPLDKPIRYGWYKQLVLREDVSRRIDAAVFQEILDMCGRHVWAKTRRLADERWEDLVRTRRRNWQWCGFARISKHRYNELSPGARKYFTAYEWKWTPWQGSIQRYYCHVPKCYFVLTYKKAYITHLQSVDSELDSKIASLENQMRQDEFYPYSWWAANSWPNKFMRKWEIRNARRRARMALRQYDEATFDQLTYKGIAY